MSFEDHLPFSGMNASSDVDTSGASLTPYSQMQHLARRIAKLPPADQSEYWAGRELRLAIGHAKNRKVPVTLPKVGRT